MTGPRYVVCIENPQVRHLEVTWADRGRLCGQGHWRFDTYSSSEATLALPVCKNCLACLRRLNREAEAGKP